MTVVWLNVSERGFFEHKSEELWKFSSILSQIFREFLLSVKGRHLCIFVSLHQAICQNRVPAVQPSADTQGHQFKTSPTCIYPGFHASWRNLYIVRQWLTEIFTDNPVLSELGLSLCLFIAASHASPKIDSQIRYKTV